MSNFFKPIKYLIIMLIIVASSTTITYFLNPNISDTADYVSSYIPEKLSQKSGLNLVFAYIFNNGVKVPISMLIFAIIPIRFLYWIQPIFTAILPGVLFGILFRYSLIKGCIVIISSFPHMLTEFLALCIWLIALDQFNQWIKYKIFKKKNDIKLLDELKLLLSSYIKYFIPLIVLAAFTETYVADWIFNLLS